MKMATCKRLSFFCLSFILSSAQQQIPLNGKPTAQGPTIGSYSANLAIDGNFDTFAASGSAHVPDNMAWWRVDMGSTYTVQSVRLATGYYNYGGIVFSLGNFDIYVVTENDIYLLCQRYTSTPIQPNANQLFQCSNGFNVGRYIYIKKIPGGNMDILALAEVQVYGQQGNNGNNNNNPSNDDVGSGRKISWFSASQSSSYNSAHGADLAMDGNIETYSIAVPFGQEAYAWWMADLKGIYSVTGITVTSSSDYTNAQYLQNFIVLVSQRSNTEDPGFRMSSSCYFYSTNAAVPIRTLFSYKCNTPLVGRYVVIRRTATGPVSLAEVAIYGNAV